MVGVGSMVTPSTGALMTMVMVVVVAFGSLSGPMGV
jgi:hypothetical protein